MNGIHDMGGMQGFGAVPIEHDEPVFHAPWEGRVYAMNLAMLIHMGGNADRFRYRLETLPPAEYLASDYYARWLSGVIGGCRDHGLLDEDEIAAINRGEVPGVVAVETFAIPADAMRSNLIGADAQAEDHSGTSRFSVGGRVRTRNIHPHGHTRLPRYARGHIGEVIADRGLQPFADDSAAGRDDGPQRLYTVRFTAVELWGEQANPCDSVCIDLWEPYLEPA